MAVHGAVGHRTLTPKGGVGFEVSVSDAPDLGWPGSDAHAVSGPLFQSRGVSVFQSAVNS
ncbi:hypothetical protein EYF80_036648 [Liparis tanakae]|uniref:Uncharacterized protein n=1 Tax=Liparis tanakae TaxID=230148 RepID=A0A4Z2GIC2_9TELE|nr:hypothetical protein EYF80_036648 [Liparis tanakae]